MEIFSGTYSSRKGYTELPSSVPHYENPIYVFLFWELRGLSPNFHIPVSVSDLYIYSQDRSTYFLQQNSLLCSPPPPPPSIFHLSMARRGRKENSLRNEYFFKFEE